MYQGRIVGEVDPQATDRTELIGRIGQMMTGGGDHG
jgi:hypothetical protein